MAFLDDFQAAMIRVAAKRVSHTDKSKSAYVTTKAQQAVLNAAGIGPASEGDGRIINVIVADTQETLPSTYYSSDRRGSGRRPEMRMGRAITQWMQEGEYLWLGTDGRNVFVYRAPSFNQQPPDEDTSETEQRFARQIDPRRLLDVVKRVRTPPGTREVRSTTFERNSMVREFARRRSCGHCEMPGCDYVGFESMDGTPFIEVHHVEAMSREGFDVVDNVAAVCPNCHAMAHYSKNRDEISSQLLRAVRKANDRYIKMLERTSVRQHQR